MSLNKLGSYQPELAFIKDANTGSRTMEAHVTSGNLETRVVGTVVV
jgi:hypothetical protein